jgi:DNA-binding NtrC family response regulator
VLDCIPTLPDSTTRGSYDATLPFMDLERLRALAVRQALQATRGHKGRAAKLLGVHANTLTRILAQMESDGSAVAGFAGE